MLKLIAKITFIAVFIGGVSFSQILSANAETPIAFVLDGGNGSGSGSGSGSGCGNGHGHGNGNGHSSHGNGNGYGHANHCHGMSGRIVRAVLLESTNYWNNSVQELRSAYNTGQLTITVVVKHGVTQYDVIFEGIEVCLIIDA